MPEQNASLSVGTSASRKGQPRGHYRPLIQERRVKHYQFSSTEVMALSLLNPLSAGLLAWGFNLWLGWADAPEGKERHMIGVSAVVVLSAGVLIQVAVWTCVLMVRYQSCGGEDMPLKERLKRFFSLG